MMETVEPPPPETALLVGGPRDGTTVIIPRRPRHDQIETIRVPVLDSPWQNMGDVGPVGPAMQILEYRQTIVLGWPSRDDYGRLVYSFQHKEPV